MTAEPHYQPCLDYHHFGVFELFKIGIGPSSSHSVGPMHAAGLFLQAIKNAGLNDHVGSIQVDLYGSLALTGLGHGTDSAVLMGLSGEEASSIDPGSVHDRLASIKERKRLDIPGIGSIPFAPDRDIVFHKRESLPEHPNGIRFSVMRETGGEIVLERTYFSIGGGFVVEPSQLGQPREQQASVPYPFCSARDLLRSCDEQHMRLWELSLCNERVFRSDAQISDGLERIWQTMQSCVSRGCTTRGILPGGLDLPRRAPGMWDLLSVEENQRDDDPMAPLDWVNMWAVAVNEENAAGGRVVTAPTNGAAGIIPAVMHYVERFHADSLHDRSSLLSPSHRFLLTAAVIGSLYKRNASISGAEVGCQGEVGVACSMAAAALTEALGGTPKQTEQAAEIGMEHNLGLTCDPIRGLVQIPCIERNAMGAVKAINAARIALRGNGSHFVSLDRVIRVMKKTGNDMSAQYKETSQGGLAVNISEC